MELIKDKLLEAKAWYQSKTIIATIVGVVSTILGLFGYDIGDIINVSFTEAEAVAGNVDAIWVSLQAALTALLASWARIKAEVKIK